MLGYDTYLQFFPSQEPQLLSRFRATNATNVIGSSLSTLEPTPQNIDLYTQPFNYHSYVDSNLQAFTSWQQMYGPTHSHNDAFNWDAWTKLDS